ncbi:hypothetical protein [Priestia megaterium]|uniref:hypothetical protein n=1 Tax=Priestia megaterium TaxID=1404 RepID=UPI003EEBD950
MPLNREQAIEFLETQWSSINDNKERGILAEIRFMNYLNSVPTLYDYLIQGGWIITPSKNTIVSTPTHHRIVIIPIIKKFSWTRASLPNNSSAQVIAHSFFRQVGMRVYFAEPDPSPSRSLEKNFQIPQRPTYNRSYNLKFKEVGASGLVDVPIADVMRNFVKRKGNLGIKTYRTGRIKRKIAPWNNPKIVTELFWKDYTRYFLQREYLVSNNDLDFFLVSKTGKSYPVELKSKTPALDKNTGDWFGIDVGPFSKLSHFVSLSNNMDALYVVEEVDDDYRHIEWWGIRFSDLLKGCYWVQQGGGTGMTGGRSTTIKVPKNIFEPLNILLPKL